MASTTERQAPSAALLSLWQRHPREGLRDRDTRIFLFVLSSAFISLTRPYRVLHDNRTTSRTIGHQNTTPVMKKFYELTGSRLDIAIAVVAGVNFALYCYDQVVRKLETVTTWQSETSKSHRRGQMIMIEGRVWSNFDSTDPFG